jgi:hypothetical protein
MREAIKLIRTAHLLFEDTYSKARLVWTDAMALRFGDRYQKPMSEVLSRFECAAEGLVDAIEQAEATV